MGVIMGEDKTKLLKIVYFDEGSAIDYLDIYNGGIKSEIKDKGRNIGSFFKSKANISGKTGILFKALKPFLNINAEGSISGEFSRVGETVLKTTITNTVLTDFIKTADDDKKIFKINNYAVSAYKDSITFLKLYTPLLNMIEMKSEQINISKIDETLEKIKGLYELIAENSIGDKKILRFNIKAFRNNYNLADLSKMHLTFYSIEVGKMHIEQLNAKNELDFSKDDVVTSEMVLHGSKINNNEIPIYDVILAGITSNE
jgi:hypothetical protein